MDGWAFAAAALGVVCCFEFLVFRYFTPEPTPRADGTDDGSDGGAAASGGREHGRGRAARAGDGSDPDPVAVCEHCGTPNADEPTVIFCRSCLGRLR